MLLPCLHPELIEAGCDEAGRGCLAGPVFAAAVILPEDFHHPWLNDSKQLSEKKRDLLRPIIEQEALAWCVAEVSPEEIDQINILQASITGMHRAVDGLKIRPEHLLIDGNRFKPYCWNGEPVPHTCYVHGDARFASIAAASVLAKVTRDDIMVTMAQEHPGYGFEIHKGYGTKAHYAALTEHGMCDAHRRTFLRKFYGEK